MDLRAFIALAAALCAVTTTSRAGAWQEAHQSGDDALVRIESNGVASVRHLVRWRVVRGPVKSIDLVNVDPAAILEPDVAITSEDGHAFSGHLARADDKSIRVLVDQPKALMRGTFVFQVQWRIDLAATHALSYDGATWRLTWSAPVASDGLDAARTVFDLPGAPDEPRPILADTGAVDETAVATVRHDGPRDVLEIVRPHVARGESASYTVRIDPRALPGMSDPALRPVRPPPPPEADRVHEAALALWLGGLALGFGLLIAHKHFAFAREAAARGAICRGLVPLPRAARATLAGLAFAGGVALEVAELPLAGAALIAVATLAAALGKPIAGPAVRGPGRWLALRPDDAFPASSVARHWLDFDATAGRVAIAACAALTVALAIVSRRFAPEGPWLVSLDAMALVPVFVTGRIAQLPPDGDRSAVPWLKPSFDRLRAFDALRAVPWGRVTVDGARVDELRLLVLPRAAMPGVAGIELGLAWSSTPVGWTGSPEVLVRVLDGSAAAARLARVGPLGDMLPGRRPDERVLRAVPRRGTPSGAVTLARAFAEALTDRRTEPGARTWTAPERRGVRGERAPVAA